MFVQHANIKKLPPESVGKGLKSLLKKDIHTKHSYQTEINSIFWLNDIMHVCLSTIQWSCGQMLQKNVKKYCVMISNVKCTCSKIGIKMSKKLKAHLAIEPHHHKNNCKDFKGMDKRSNRQAEMVDLLQRLIPRRKTRSLH